MGLKAVANPAAGGQPGSFTSLTVSGLTAGRVVYTGTGGLLSASANLTYDGDVLALSSTSANPAATFTNSNGFAARFNGVAYLVNGMTVNGDISTWANDGGVKVAFNGSGSIAVTPATGQSLIVNNMPTSSAGLAAGSLWNDAGTVKIV